jgi:hypothetical protein
MVIWHIAILRSILADIDRHAGVEVFGADVRKTRDVVALDRPNKRHLDSTRYHRRDGVAGKLKDYRQIPAVVDQPAAVRLLPVAAGRAKGVLVTYLLGLVVRRPAGLRAREARPRREMLISSRRRRGKAHRLIRLTIA